MQTAGNTPRQETGIAATEVHEFIGALIMALLQQISDVPVDLSMEHIVLFRDGVVERPSLTENRVMVALTPRAGNSLGAAQKNKDRADSIAAAIKYIESGAAPLSDEEIVVAGKKVAQAIKIGRWRGNKPPQYNEEKDKALVACEFIAGRDLLVHTATFHKVDGKWKLRGVRETMQVLLAREPETDAQAEDKK